MAVVSLTREVSSRVTIHAARMAQHRNDALKSSRTIIRRCALLRCGFDTLGLPSGIECQQESSYEV
jgi:hypothetical protein